MASPELEGASRMAEEAEEIKRSDSTAKKMKKKSKRGFYGVPKFGCFGIKSESDGKGNLDMEVEERFRRRTLTHLVIMVNGLIGSSQNWKFAAKQFLKKYPDDVVVHCSESNYSTLTFDGVDVMGERLAEEVISVVKRHPGVQKISFIGHSLGGLIARYAIARLYAQEITREPSQNMVISLDLPGVCVHQVPVFCGFYTLEKVASRTSWFLGKTGRHLFLTDGDSGKPPLLLWMASDTENLKFISALRSFRRRVAYANVRFDHLVGWSTSSLRRRNELPKLKRLSRDERYPHIVNVETARASPEEEAPIEAKVNGGKNIDMEEEMLKGLTKLSWERIDVSFSGSRQRYLAHTTIQVKGSWINSDGADVIQHMVDNFLL
ncbi:Alpha/Beta hydrolase fold containing protein [Parasponia andersonii]|uniref:Alpha/Beta hydrolase fold containing protein n=1 Tax=Parasponia andersonii TaxID=3476 RepID=A0A2P5D3K4_PARAD|nr:Alpha/Beta hydrolase fold containing protein [Parasponia andersonii]